MAVELVNMHTSFTRKLISDKFGALTEMAWRKLKLLEKLDSVICQHLVQE